MKSKRNRPPRRRRAWSAARNIGRPPGWAATYAATSSMAVARSKVSAGRRHSIVPHTRWRRPSVPPSRAMRSICGSRSSATVRNPARVQYRLYRQVPAPTSRWRPAVTPPAATRALARRNQLRIPRGSKSRAKYGASVAYGCSPREPVWVLVMAVRLPRLGLRLERLSPGDGEDGQGAKEAAVPVEGGQRGQPRRRLGGWHRGLGLLAEAQHLLVVLGDDGDVRVHGRLHEPDVAEQPGQSAADPPVGQ